MSALVATMRVQGVRSPRVLSSPMYLSPAMVTISAYRDMVETAAVTATEDLEYIVQAARGEGEEEEERRREVEEGSRSPLILRHPRMRGVTFNDQDDIRPISTLQERAKSERKNKNKVVWEEEEGGENEERKEKIKRSTLSWLTGSLRRKKKDKETVVESKLDGISETKTAPTKDEPSPPKAEAVASAAFGEVQRRNTLACLPAEARAEARAEVRLRPRSSTEGVRRSVARRSASLRSSCDSLSGVSAEIREKILAWRQSPPSPTSPPSPRNPIRPASPRSPRSPRGSRDMEHVAPTDPEAADLARASRASLASLGDLIEDRVALERLEQVYMAKSLTSAELAPDLAPALPSKTTAFHILQLERLLAGNLRPREQVDEEAAALLLDSLRVVASMEGAVRPREEPVYDVPRALEVPSRGEHC